MSKVKIKELRDQNSVTLTQARALLDQVKDDTPQERAAELEAQHDAAMNEYRNRERQIERLEGVLAAEEREAEARQNNQRDNRPHPGSGNGGGNEEGPSYREVFRKTLQYGVNELTPDERAVLQAGRSGITPEERALATGSGATGGYLIPTELMPTIDRAMVDYAPMWDPEVTRHMVTASGNPISQPTLDYTAKRGELHTEGGATTDDGSSDPAFGNKVLNAYIYKSGIVRVSLELLQDSQWDLESLLEELFGESLGATVNEVLTVANGTDKPQGILTFAGTGKAAAAAAALTGDELIDLQHSVPAPYRKSPKCRWQFNDLTLGAIRKLKDGNGNYLWQEANIRSGEPATLLGHRYEVNPAMPDIGAAASPVLFGDHNKYIVRKVGAPGMIVFREKYMDELEVGFMAYRRLDGKGIQPKALKKLTMAGA